MSTTITHAGGTITAFMPSWDAGAEARSIVHTILGRPDPDITTRPTGLRDGVLELKFTSEADAVAARAVLAVPQPLTLANSVVGAVGMVFMVAGGRLGEVRSEAGVWTLSVPFQEITP